MKISKLLSALFAATLLFTTSCRTDDPIDDPQPKGAYENGIFLSNEGNFGSPTATVSFISNDLSIENKIYSANNGGAVLGDVLQNIGVNGDNAYLILNNSNKIEIVNRYTFKKIATVSDQVSQPRYIAFAGNNYYVTNSSGSSKFVNVYNSTTNTFVKKIDLTSSGERIVEASGKIFVQNASFGSGNKITIINPTSNTVEKEVTVPNGNIKKTISTGGNVYTIASTSTDSYIYKLSPTGAISSTITLTGIANGSNLEIDGTKFFFSSGAKVYSMDLSSTVIPTTPVLTLTDNSWSALYGFSVIDGKIYISNANGFTADSTVEIYSTAGTLLKTVTAGRGTNGFYKN
ncbi:YncE family protein [Kaistella sp.]|uniref:YncE family protein n=1 Tax=Kaistella sp. TaxID=2782235 RepID=UPI00359F70FF